MMRNYGPEASAQAAIRAAHCFVRGEASGMLAWQQIVDAIVVLDSDQPIDGATIH